MLTEELHDADLNQLILLFYDLAFEINIVLGFPVGGRSQTIPVLGLDQLADYLETYDVKGLRKLALVEHLK